MAKAEKTYSFIARLQAIDNAPGYQGVIIPQDIVAQLPQKGRPRVKGKLNDVEFSLAVQNIKTGQRYFMISAPLRRAAKVKTDDIVKISFHLVDSSIVELPEELIVVLDQDDEARAKWETFTAGRQRSLAHYVTSAKSLDVRIKRALDLLHKIKTDTLYGQVVSARKKLE